jgi:hypothetical protein
VVRHRADAVVAAQQLLQGGSVLSAVTGGPGPLQAALDAALGVLLRN